MTTPQTTLIVDSLWMRPCYVERRRALRANMEPPDCSLTPVPPSNDGPVNVAILMPSGKFRVFTIENWLDTHRTVRADLVGGIFYWPYDESATIEDADGAYAAYPNADNTGWLFKKTEKGFHHDHEATLWNTIVSRFHPELSEMLVRMVVESNQDDDVKFRTYQIAYESLLEFQSDVIEYAIGEARKKHIGHIHDNPHESHVFKPAGEAVAAVKAKWQAGDDSTVTKFRAMANAVGRIEKSLELHDYKYRHIMEAEAAAAAKKAAEAEE